MTDITFRFHDNGSVEVLSDGSYQQACDAVASHTEDRTACPAVLNWFAAFAKPITAAQLRIAQKHALGGHDRGESIDDSFQHTIRPAILLAMFAHDDKSEGLKAACGRMYDQALRQKDRIDRG